MRFGIGDNHTVEEQKASRNGQGDEALDEMLDQALRHFRLSVHAWSDAVYSRPRTVAHQVRQRSWRLAAGCALGCALAAGSITGVVHERHQRQQAARQAAAERAAEQQRLAAAQRARAADADLMATVDSDVSRAVPQAMEPLAALMSGDADQ
jgi:type VI protein secretion system component VasK